MVLSMQPTILAFGELSMPIVTPNPLWDLPNLKYLIYHYCKTLLGPVRLQLI